MHRDTGVSVVIDVVLYGGERDLLKARFDHVRATTTILVESDYTFTGQYKGFTFVEDLPGVIYVPVESSRHDDPWANEAEQRNAAMNVLESLGLDDFERVGLFDVDEFPDMGLWRSSQGLAAWSMSKYQMSVYWFQHRELTGVSGLWSQFRGRDLDEVRRSRYSLPQIEGGYHFSSFMDSQGLVKKWVGFSHTELMRDDMAEWVDVCARDGLAIESGELLTELLKMNHDMPEFMRQGRGPECWYRRRV